MGPALRPPVRERAEAAPTEAGRQAAHRQGVFIRLGGRQHSLWRAVDQDGHVLDILAQSRRNTKAAKRFVRTLLRGLQHVPRVIVVDKLGSDAAARAKSCPMSSTGKANA